MGSRACLTARCAARSAGDRMRSSQGALATPMPCSAEMVPPRSATARRTTSARRPVSEVSRKLRWALPSARCPNGINLAPSATAAACRDVEHVGERIERNRHVEFERRSATRRGREGDGLGDAIAELDQCTSLCGVVRDHHVDHAARCPEGSGELTRRIVMIGAVDDQAGSAGRNRHRWTATEMIGDQVECGGLDELDRVERRDRSTEMPDQVDRGGHGRHRHHRRDGVFEAGNEPQPRRRDDRQRAFRADHQRRPVHPGRLLRESGERADHIAARQDGLHADHLLAHRAEAEHPRAAGVRGHGTADRGRVTGREVHRSIEAGLVGVRPPTAQCHSRTGGHLHRRQVDRAEVVEPRERQDDGLSVVACTVRPRGPRHAPADEPRVPTLRNDGDARAGARHGRPRRPRRSTRAARRPRRFPGSGLSSRPRTSPRWSASTSTWAFPTTDRSSSTMAITRACQAPARR